MVTKRRIDVMLSSTFRDLSEHRKVVLQAMNAQFLQPLAQEFDSALPDSDVIKASLDKVDAADAYVCIIGSRYGQRPACATRNPQQLSLTELEYLRAIDRKLPRCIFIMSEDHPLTRGDLDRSLAEGPDSQDRRRALIERARKERIVAEFTSPDDLRAKATTSFVLLRNSVDGKLPEEEPAPTEDDFPPPVAPPNFHYVRKPYIQNQIFAGRIAELDLIDRWASGPNAMLLLQAIGGMGKSMLSWHWVKTRSHDARADWAGQLWYSFYEQGADLNDFCVQALSYIREEPPKSLRGRRTLDLGNELRRQLDAHPHLLVLDGLERVLVAYNRSGKEHMTDEDAVVARDALGLDREPRNCFRPEDDEVLAMLAQATKGKLLTSSRLTPTALTNAARRPIPGVSRIALDGLAPPDAEQVLRNTGVRGDTWRMRHFLEEKFRCHPLSVGVVAGQIITSLDDRGDFDSWLKNPRGGADPSLIAKDLRGRQNHILSRAFDDLSEDQRLLLGSIAMAEIELNPEVLRLLNPMRPIEPKRLEPPAIKSERDLYLSTADRDIDNAYIRWRDAKSASDREAAQETLDKFRENDFLSRKSRYESRETERVEWRRSSAKADEWLVQTLPGLEARGLLQYDSQNGRLDMHPAIRHTIMSALSPEAKSTTGSHVSDALSSRPVKPFVEAKSLQDLAIATTRVEALNEAGKLEQGWNLFCESGLDEALFRLHYFHERLEILHHYFPAGWNETPALPQEKQATAIEKAATALQQIGELSASCHLYEKAIALSLKDESLTATFLGNFAISLSGLGEGARSRRLNALALQLAEALDDRDDLHWLKCNEAMHLIDRGLLDSAEVLLESLRPDINKEGTRAARKAHLLSCETVLAFQRGRLTEVIAQTSLDKARLLGQRFAERSVLLTIATWHQKHERHSEALEILEDLVALANEVGSPRLQAYEARRALSLAALGKQKEALRIARKVDRGAEHPMIALAECYALLGDRERARLHALACYTKAWGEGPPYYDLLDIETCRRIFGTLGVDEPSITNASIVEPFGFEPDVSALIIKKALARPKTPDVGN